jgi:hypothetical protein
MIYLRLTRKSVSGVMRSPPILPKYKEGGRFLRVSQVLPPARKWGRDPNPNIGSSKTMSLL